MKLGNLNRLSLLTVLFLAGGLIVMGQLVRIQLLNDSNLDALRLSRSGEWTTLEPTRGDIYDRWGNLIAGSETVYEIGIDINSVQDPQTVALVVNALFGHDFNEVFNTLTQADSSYYFVADYVSSDIKLRLDRWVDDLDTEREQSEKDTPSLSGFVYKSHLKRSYPGNILAFNLLGFVSREGRGYYGVEQELNYLLAGEPKRVWLPYDPNEIEMLYEVENGKSLILTIDRELQTAVQDILDRAVKQYGAKGGAIVVMDPKTGEIWAMASAPMLNINEFWKIGEVFEEDQAYNKGVWNYEPGSVFKVITMAAALDANVVTPETEFIDEGEIEIAGAIIRNWDKEAWGQQDMVGCMQHSLNVCLAWVASELGAEQFYQYIREFGFGQPTGIELADEHIGNYRSIGDPQRLWHESDLATNSFGQGLSVTPVQMVMAVSALANEGRMVLPHVVKAVVDNGIQYEISDQSTNHPISPETAKTISQMLVTSLEGEASVALVPGYEIAGKTGTAEIPTDKGYTSNLTNASFVGWGPIDDAKFIVYVWIQEPLASQWGSEVAAPVFNQVVRRIITLMKIPPDNVGLANSEELAGY